MTDSLYICLQRALHNLIFSSKHDWKIDMLSAWFGAFFKHDSKELFIRLGNNFFERIIKRKKKFFFLSLQLFLMRGNHSCQNKTVENHITEF